MASSIDVDKLLECPICLEQLKQPKMLKCQHTFCFDPCLQKMAKIIRKKKKYQLECAICREKCAVEELSDFADNLYLKNLLEIRNNPPKPLNQPNDDEKNGLVGKKFLLRILFLQDVEKRIHT